MPNNRVILHVDLNSYFATAEQQANPYLRGRPVGIVKGVGRGCIIAASVEAKRRGVSTGSNVYEARKVCPSIILVPADFSKYADITYRFINICKSYSPVCEVFSLDECFIDVTDTEQFWGNVFNIAFDLKSRLKVEVGDYMSCSVGVSHNRLLAKLASNQIKPDGLFWITEDNMLSVLDKSELTGICGLGWGLERHLKELGIDSFPKLREQALPFLQKHFGPYWSLHLYNVSRGIDNSQVASISEIADAKSVGRTYTTHRTLTNRAEIYKLVRNLCEEAAHKARQMGLCGRYVGLILRSGDREKTPSPGWLASRNFSESWFGHQTLKHYIDDGQEFFNTCMQIADGWNIDSVRFCGVTLGMLQRKDYQPVPLFKKDRNKQRLLKTVDNVNSKYGDYTVYPGQLLGIPIIMPEVNGFFGDRKFRLNFLRH